MKTYEVRVVEETGEVTSTFFQAGSLELLYAHLEEVAPNLVVLGCPKEVR